MFPLKFPLKFRTKPGTAPKITANGISFSKSHLLLLIRWMSFHCLKMCKMRLFVMRMQFRAFPLSQQTKIPTDKSITRMNLPGCSYESKMHYVAGDPAVRTVLNFTVYDKLPPENHVQYEIDFPLLAERDYFSLPIHRSIIPDALQTRKDC